MAGLRFADICEGLTRDECEQVAWHLAMLRARRTVDGLMAVVDKDGPAAPPSASHPR